MKEDNLKKSLAKNEVCAIFHMRDMRKNVLPKFIKLCHGDAMFVSHSGAQIWPPETNRKICFLMREFFARGTH